MINLLAGRRLAFHVIVGCCLAPSVSLSAAAADTYVKVWNRTLVGSSAFSDTSGTVKLPSLYQDHQVSLYLDHQRGPWAFSLEGVPVGVADYAGSTVAYFGGMTGSLRYRLAFDGFGLAVRAHIGARPDVDPLGTEVIDGKTFLVVPTVGSFFGGGALVFDVPLSFGWLKANGGSRLFTADALSTAFFAGAEFGWQTSLGLVLKVDLSWYHSLDLPEPINVLGSGNTRYLGFGMELSYWFVESVSVQLGLGGAFFARHNAATPSINAGVAFRL
jgi:hypothetical protein